MKTHDWQPIDTCPPDAEYVAIWEGGLAFSDARRDETGRWSSIPYPYKRPSGEPYQLFMACHHKQPSHWMPMPIGPENKDEGWRSIVGERLPLGACVEVWTEGRWLPRAVCVDGGYAYYAGQDGCWIKSNWVRPEFWRPIVAPDGCDAACENIRVDNRVDDTEIAGRIRAMAGEEGRKEQEVWVLNKAADLLDRLLEGVAPKFVARRPFVYASEGSELRDPPRRDAMFQMPREEGD